MLRPAALLLVAIIVIAACDANPQPAPPSAGAIADDMTAALAAKPLPVADLFDLTRRLKGQDGSPAAAFQAARQAPLNEPVGTIVSFWTYDFDAKKNVKVNATLRVLGEHAKWWVADGVTVDPAALQTTAGVFDARIYPTDRAAYGSEWSPGIDADARIDVLIARIPGRAAGYFSSADEYPLWVNAFSAEREMIYVNSMSARLATDNLYSVLAHEFCHMIQFNKRARSIVWFNEGQAQLCERLNTVPSQFEVSFLRQPDTQLDDWPDLDDTAILHYGGSLLFLEWLQRHAGGDDLINALMDHGVDTPNDIDAVLKARGQPGMDEQFADFVAANALIGPDAPDRYAYRDLRLGVAATATSQDRLAAPGELKATVHEYAARYVALPQRPAHITFTGPTSTRVIPTDPHSGRAMWWSDRADGLDASMTRQVDLRTTAKATLSFWSWYEIEKDFDYAYAAISTDAGAHWTTLRTEATTTDDPNGNNLGNGLTGTSGGTSPSWVKQTADLTPFAGKQVLLRFEYVTDGALNLNGVAIDDIAIPEIGYSDDAESDNGWTASGFIRSTNKVQQRFVVQLIRFGPTPTVERHVVVDGTLELDVDGSTDRKPPLLAITGLAPRTTTPVAFTVRAAAR